MYRITVLMSTYNGEKYLKEQIDSILNQSNVSVELVIRDDCSNDSTPVLIDDYARRFKNIRIIKDSNKLGACKSFLSLISSNCVSDYYALADQDDVWDTDKLYVAINRLNKYDDSEPLLYYSNLRVVDEKLKFNRMFYEKPPTIATKYSCLMETYASGCTIVYNKKLAEVAHRIKADDYSMHDTFLFNVASLIGKTIYDPQPHISYRQHQNNVIGTSSSRAIIKRLSSRINRLLDNTKTPYSNNARVLIAHGKGLWNKDCYIKLLKMSTYKRSFKRKLSLIFDRDIRTTNFFKNIRFAALVILNIA